MGYYTSHELTVIHGDSELISELREDSEGANYAIDDNGDTNESCKWYEHERDLRSFSSKHSGVLFMLSGEGEEAGDLWHEYYKDGKMQRCKAVITFDEFKEELLT